MLETQQRNTKGNNYKRIKTGSTPRSTGSHGNSNRSRRNQLDKIRRDGISGSAETLTTQSKKIIRPRSNSVGESEHSLKYDYERVPPINGIHQHERYPLHEFWAEVSVDVTATSIPNQTERNLSQQRLVLENSHYQQDTIQLIDLEKITSPRAKRSSLIKNQNLIIEERCIKPRSSNGVLQQPIKYSEITKIGFGFTEFSKPYILMQLSPRNHKHHSYIFTFDTYETRNQCICTILWRAACLRIIEQLIAPDIKFNKFEQLHTDLLHVHRQPSKLTSFDQSLEHLQLTIHNASALEMLADSIADILKHQKHNQKLIEYLAKSASFIENLEQFLQYNPITACPQLSKILELHCSHKTKTDKSEQVIRQAVIKAIHHSSLYDPKYSIHCQTSNRANVSQIRANLKDLTLTYIKSVNPNLYATDGKKRYEKNLELFVRELHGKGNCPHLLTLNNIYQIAAYSIEQSYRTNQNTESCLLCPIQCSFTRHRLQIELGANLLFYAAKFDDWRDQLSALITPFPFPIVTKSCKVFGNLLHPLLKNLIETGNATKLSGILLHPDAISWLKLSSVKCDSASTCLTTTAQCELFKSFLTAFHNSHPQLSPTVLKTICDHYLEDTWPLARQENIPAIEILIRCLNTNIFQNRSDIEKTKRILRSTPEGEKRYEADIRERAQLSAPGGERSKSFPSSTTDQEVREFLMSNRGGHLEDLNLSCTAISDCIFEVIVKLPALKTLNLMTTRITDEGLLTLSYAQKLKCLNLNECERITPTGLRYLTRLRNLTTLSINCTSLDDEVFEELRSSLPMLETVDHRYTNVLYR